MIRRRHLGSPETEPQPEPTQPMAAPTQPARTDPSKAPLGKDSSQPAPTSKEAEVSQRPESIQSVPRAAGDQTVTVIGNGARLEGNLIAAASLRIEGTVTGTITAEGDVIVAPEAEVSADIHATNTTIGGHYKGNVVATGTIELTSTARVEGNLTSRALVVNQGAIFSGQSIMDGGAKKPSAVPSPASTAAGSGSGSSSGSGSPSGGASGAAPKATSAPASPA